MIYYDSLYFNMQDNSLDGSLGNLNDLIDLNVSNRTYNYWSNFVNNIVNNTNCYIAIMWLQYNQLSGTLPKYLPKCAYSFLYLDGNRFSGSILSDWRVSIFRGYDNEFDGTIGDNFIHDNSDYSMGTWMQYDLFGNKFTGSVATGFINTKGLQIVLLSDNQFDTLPRGITSTALQKLALNNNSIVEYNVGEWLEGLFENTTSLTHVLINNNDKISGDINNWKTAHFAFDQSIETHYGIMMHECDIYGHFSDELKIKLGKIEYDSINETDDYGNSKNEINKFDIIVTIFSNSDLDWNGKQIVNSKNVTGLAILGNLFTVSHDQMLAKATAKNDDTMDTWFNEEFLEATNLFITNWDQVIMYVYLIISTICYICLCFYYVKKININGSNVFQMSQKGLKIAKINCLSGVLIIIITITILPVAKINTIMTVEWNKHY